MSLYMQDSVMNIREALSLFDRNISELSARNGIDFRPDSSAEAEIEEAGEHELLTTAVAISSLLVEVSSEHMSAFVKTITEPIEPLACWTNVRCMMEACAIAAWMLEPDVGWRIRTKRVYAYRYVGLVEEKKWARSTQAEAPEIDGIESRIERLESEATALGFAHVRDRHGKRDGIGCRMPKPTDIIRTVLGQESFYRLSSAVAHGHHWATSMLGFEVKAEATIGSDRVAMMGRKVDPSFLAYVAAKALLVEVLPIWNLHRYMGWDTLPLEEIVENCADKLDVGEAVRFWRKPIE